jgi:nucleoside-diphosphate-sugar epimerase
LQRCNIDATTHLVRAAAALPRAPLFVFCSSGAVFGDQPCLPITEDAQPNPIGDYARSKLEAERVASRIAGASGMPLVIARIFNVIGPGLQPRHLPAYLAHRIAEIELLACEPVIEIGSLTTTRDLVDVRDVAVVLARLGRGSPDVFNIASGRETPMRDVAWRLAKMSTRDISFQLRTGRSKVGADRIVAVIGAMRRIGVEPRPLAASLEDMLAYARSAAARHADRILNPL